jgi:hypothetical protein
MRPLWARPGQFPACWRQPAADQDIALNRDLQDGAMPPAY